MTGFASLFLAFMTIVGLMGCYSIPKNPEEFRQIAHSTSMGKRIPFRIENASAKTVQDRMETFAKRCLRQEVHSSYSQGTYVESNTDVYTPTVVAEQNRLTLFMQERYKHGVAYPTGTPEAGLFFMMTEVTRDQGENWSGTAYCPPMGKGNLLEDTVNWLQDKKRLCPNFANL